MPLLLALATFAQSSSLPSAPTGLEWMPIVSVVVPAVLLIALVWAGQRRRV